MQVEIKFDKVLSLLIVLLPQNVGKTWGKWNLVKLLVLASGNLKAKSTLLASRWPFVG